MHQSPLPVVVIIDKMLLGVVGPWSIIGRSLKSEWLLRAENGSIAELLKSVPPHGPCPDPASHQCPVWAVSNRWQDEIWSYSSFKLMYVSVCNLRVWGILHPQFTSASDSPYTVVLCVFPGLTQARERASDSNMMWLDVGEAFVLWDGVDQKVLTGILQSASDTWIHTSFS